MACSRFSKSCLIVLGAALFMANPAAFSADQYFDAGLKSFQAKKYKEATSYFEQSIKNQPWESITFYYCALAYHYAGDFKKAAEKYGDCVERFPGTQASTSALAALKVIDPQYLTRKAAAVAAATAAAKNAGAGGSTSPSAAAEDKGTVEGDQSRVNFRMVGSDKVVNVRINGRNTPVIFDPNSENTSFSRSQLSSLAINPDKSSTKMKCEIALGTVTRKNFPITVDDSGQPAKIGNSFLDAFNITVNDSGKFIDLKRKSATGGGAAGAIAFSKEGKLLLINGELNGRQVRMIFDPDGEGLSMTAAQAKAAGLKADEADAVHQSPGEGPQRGDPNWVPPEDRATGPKVMSARMKLGPVERPNTNLQIIETGGAAYPKIGADFISGNGYKYDIDYKSNKIMLTRK
jgi:hypothetical protein